ncbi:putative heterokaryon incompatibility [Septoria linicola]|nr:putative heterokaryon incompatibility [Septoria linicola]
MRISERASCATRTVSDMTSDAEVNPSASKRLLRTDCEELKLETFNDERKLPKYAILSHVWLAAEEEVTYQDVKLDIMKLRKREGWAKLDYTRKHAQQDGYQYCWIDTCCIDKSSSAELTEAINSMYRWYSVAETCYVYLADMPSRRRAEIFVQESEEEIQIFRSEPFTGSIDLNFREQRGLMLGLVDPATTSALNEEEHAWDWEALGRCIWFTRGWTLQEMIAPLNVEFYSASWGHIGPLAALVTRLADMTERMSWASSRVTTKIEDQAYSPLGIFDLNLPIIYGEGAKAFQRLQTEIIRAYSDQTIFAWLALASSGEDVLAIDFAGPPPPKQKFLKLLAESPGAFKGCSRVVSVQRESDDPGTSRNHDLTDNGVRFNIPSRSRQYFAAEEGNSSYYPKSMIVALQCRHQDDPAQTWILELAQTREDADSYLAVGSKVQPGNDAIWVSENKYFINRRFSVT